MRIHTVFALLVGWAVASCDDSSDPTAPGTLIVSTATEGDRPDLDGYLLTIDGVTSLALAPTGTTETELMPGRHSLRLLGIDEHCSVSSATSLQVEVPARGTSRVGFAIECITTGARIRTVSTGLDLDPQGYRIVVDGKDRGPIGSNDSVLTPMDPGDRQIALLGVPPNCTVTGQASRHVPILERASNLVDFEVVCTAVTGVIGVRVDASGADVEGVYVALVDGGLESRVQPGGLIYLPFVEPGEHVISLRPPGNCTVENNDLAAVVSAGGPTRDTVDIAFVVTCVEPTGVLRITAPTTGTIPTGRYTVWGCSDIYCYLTNLLGSLAPNDTLITLVMAGHYSVGLFDVPATCQADDPYTELTLLPGDTLDVVFAVSCSP